MKKYELTEETIVDFGVTLHRIRYLYGIPKLNIEQGDLGGYVQSEENLSQEGLCLIKDGAIVTGNAFVSEDAVISGNAWVGDNAHICGNAKVSHSAIARGDTVIRGNAHIWGRAIVTGCSVIEGSVTAYNDARISHDQEPVLPHQAHLSGDVKVHDNAVVSGQSILKDSVTVCEKAKVTDRALIEDASHISGTSVISGDAHVHGDATIRKNSRIIGNAVVKENSSISDATVSGRAQVGAKSKLIGNITATDDAYVENSVIKGNVLLKDKAIVRNARLVGDMTFRDKALLNTVELNGKNILVQGDAYLYVVELKEGKDIEIRDKARLSYLAIGKLETAWIGESAVLQGHSQLERSAITSTNLTIGGEAILDIYFSIMGQNIIIFDDAFIRGRVNVGNNVTMKEMASVVNNNPLPHYFQLKDVKMSMDNAIAL